MITVTQYVALKNAEQSNGHVGNPDLLRELRLQHGLTQKEVAEAAGVDPKQWSNFSNFEKGTFAPSLNTALRLARFYETTVEELFGHLIAEGASETTESS